ncbi:MAG TPA: hypothetical protein VJ600_08395 [Holophagaceae bacterium]|nr:hypothetical protein [Holophagaceae bacterium]
MKQDLNLRPGWISHLFAWGLLAGSVALPFVGFRFAGAELRASAPLRHLFLAVVVACVVASALLARFILHRGHRFDEEGMTQIRPFRPPQHIRWDELAFIVVLPGSQSWLCAFGQDRQQVVVDSNHLGSSLKWIAASFLNRAPKDLWELQPETRKQLQDLIDGAVPWYHRPLF